MGEYLDKVPVEVQDHIRQITRSSGLPDTEDSVEMIAKGWLEKQELFEKRVTSMKMDEVDSLGREDEQGCLAMTFSGSLLAIGPLREDGRRVQYASIGLREDVPEMADPRRLAPGRRRARRRAGPILAGPDPELLAAVQDRRHRGRP